MVHLYVIPAFAWMTIIYEWLRYLSFNEAIKLYNKKKKIYARQNNFNKSDGNFGFPW